MLETEEFPGQVAGRKTGLAFGKGKMQVERKVPHAPGPPQVGQRLEGVPTFGLPNTLSHPALGPHIRTWDQREEPSSEPYLILEGAG